eukprot:Amastigsp_a175039_14.p3 type:complete len:206 gc:universal Amastigsp_a175039_14:875-258(-)
MVAWRARDGPANTREPLSQTFSRNGARKQSVSMLRVEPKRSETASDRSVGDEKQSLWIICSVSSAVAVSSSSISFAARGMQLHRSLEESLWQPLSARRSRFGSERTIAASTSALTATTPERSRYWRAGSCETASMSSFAVTVWPAESCIAARNETSLGHVLGRDSRSAEVRQTVDEISRSTRLAAELRRRQSWGVVTRNSPSMRS